MDSQRKCLIWSPKQGFHEAWAYELNLEGQVASEWLLKGQGINLVCAGSRKEGDGGKERGQGRQRGERPGQRHGGRIMDNMLEAANWSSPAARQCTRNSDQERPWAWLRSLDFNF